MIHHSWLTADLVYSLESLLKHFSNPTEMKRDSSSTKEWVAESTGVRDLLPFYPTGHFVHLLSSLKRGIHFYFNTSFPSPAHLGLVSTITTAGRDGKGKRGPDFLKRTNSECNVGQQGTSLYDGMARSQVGLSRDTVSARLYWGLMANWSSLRVPIHFHCLSMSQSPNQRLFCGWPKRSTLLSWHYNWISR